LAGRVPGVRPFLTATPPMKIVVGLGNPGKEYQRTRHNVGFEVLAELARRWHADPPRRKFQSEIVEGTYNNERVLLVAPQTYMNLSGDAVGQVVKFYQVPLDDVLVVCDDMNLPLGRLRFRGQGSAGGQKGLKHILQTLSSEAVPRLRIGIGRPPGQMDPVDYVLSRFRKEETDLHEATILRAADGVEVWLRQGIAAAMNEFNGAEPDGSTSSSM
jgi:PTH1 family peptidyl-tRNA hydrolase